MAGTSADKLKKLKQTKADIKAAIQEKGQAVSDDDTFASYADKIRAIAVNSDEQFARYLRRTLTEVDIPNFATVPDNAFQNQTQLVSVNMPKVTSISGNAFANCTSLVLTELPSGLKSIGYKAFSNCTSLALTEFPSSLKTITGYAFDGCNLGTIIFNDKPSSIDTYAFFGANLTDIYVPWAEGEVANAPWRATEATIHYDYKPPSLAYTLSSDGTYYAVSGIGNITDTDIVIPSAYNGLPVKAIGAQAFEGNTSITSVTIPDSIVTIEYDAFSGCTALTSIVIPDSVTTISWYVFNGCTALTEATIGSGVTSIGDNAFYGCKALHTVTFANNGVNLTYMGKSVFASCYALNTFEIPRGLTNLLFGTIATNGKYENGVDNYGITSITIPSSIKTLANRSIYACYDLTSVTFEGTPEDIHSRLFESCSKLTDIYVPWVEGTFADAESAWQTMGATINYNYTG